MRKDRKPLNKASLILSSHTLDLENFELSEKYLIFQPMVKGSHSVIYYGADKQTRQERALKFYNFREIEELQGFKKKEIVKRVSKIEWDMRGKCKGMNLVNCFDVYEDRDYKMEVYDWCTDSLKEELEQRGGRWISQLRAILIIKQIVNGLKSLHQGARTLHVDLQPKHILIKNGIYKINDLGLPKLSEEEESAFVSPEVMKKKFYDSKAEVWSIGVLFHTILFGEPPYFYKNNSSLDLMNRNSGSIFQPTNGMSHISQPVKNFLARCLCVSVEERMSWREMETHQMFDLLNSPISCSSSIVRHSQGSKKEIESMRKRENSLMSVIFQLQDETATQKQSGWEQLLEQQFSRDLIVRKLKQDVEKQYVRAAGYFMIQQIDRTSVRPLKERIDRSEEEYFLKIWDYYLKCLKVEFIYLYIVCPFLQSDRISQRPIIEVLNLILGTCFTAISYLKAQKQIKPLSAFQNLVESCAKRATAQLYQVISARWNQLSIKLTIMQSKILFSVFDKLNELVGSKQRHLKDKFLNGLEKHDFQARQKWEFTQQFAEKHIIIPLRKKQKNGRQIDAFDYLLHYVKIWEISGLQQIEENYSSLKQYIDCNITKSVSHSQ